jgi:UDPglucose 6-dehydrogenase
MRLTIFGSGYVGLVTGACFAEVGNNVLCVDVDQRKVEMLKRGESPIYEPGLDDLLKRNLAAGRLNFTTDAAEGVKYGLFQFIAVGTPPDEDGSADLKYVLSVAEAIGRNVSEYRVVVTKSTVPVGTADKVRAKIDTDNPRTAELLKALYDPFTRNRERMIVMDVRSSELTKYAANAMLATKISFMNELANLAERMGADIEKVRLGIGSDPRIGYHFIYPGCGYGGSCFPKDVQALARSAGDHSFDAALLNAVETVNNRQKSVLLEKLKRHFGGNLSGKTIALWGLAFKPNTDDMREAPSRTLIEGLWAEGAKVRAYDPVANEEASRIYGERGDDLTLVANSMEALHGADALAIVTEWQEFRSPDFDTIKAELSEPVIFDGRNLYDPGFVKRFGLKYYAIGRGDSLC